MSEHDDNPEFHYKIDAADRLESVDPEWESFAAENEADRLTSDTVSGVSIWDYISGYEVKHLYEMMFDAVRRQQKEVHVPFRCDSPDCRRFMELTIEPQESGSLALTGSLLREEPRPRSDLLAATNRDPDRFLTICSWCKRVDVGNDVWVEVEDAVRELSLFNGALVPTLTHGMCLDCLASVEAELEKL